MKHLFIVNPIAGKGKALGFIPEIKRIFSNSTDEYFIEMTKGPEHATEIVRSYVNENNYRVYSIGGDGTLNEVLNGIVGSNSSLAVIPGGSGNDFFRGINTGSTTKDLLLRTVIGKEKIIDIAKVNERYFLNISSVGFDAETSFNTDYVKNIPLISGSIAYIIGVFLTLVKNKSYKVCISYNENKYSQRILLAAIANGRYYGGGIKPTPNAELDDGMFDICIVKALGRLKIIRLFPKYIAGNHTNMKEVYLTKTKKVEIWSEEDIPLNIDGEVLKVKHALFEIIPKGIKIIIPGK